MSLFLHRSGMLSGYPKFLLDQYGGAAAAFSLRCLNSIFLNDYFVTVRRSSDNDEVQVKYDKTLATPALSLNSPLVGSASTFGTFVSGTDGFVPNWRDVSGNGRDATQATAGNQPMIVENGVINIKNGQPAIVFGSAAVFFNISSLALGSDFSLFTVFEAGGNAKLLSQSNGPGGSPRIDFEQGDPDQVELVSNGFFDFDKMDAPGNINAQFLGSIFNNSGKIDLYVNGAGSSENTLNLSGSFTFTTIGGQDSSVLQELCIYPQNQSANRAAIEANIATHYGITLS